MIKMKFPEDFVNKIICGDCIKVMENIDDNSIDFILTDPPFNVGLKYKSGIDDQLPPEEYYEWCKKWGVHLYRVLKPQHYAVVESSDLHLIFVQKAMMDSGFIFHHYLKWYKPQCQRAFSGTVLFGRVELMLLLSKGKPNTSLINRKVMYQDILQYSNRTPLMGDFDHPAARPIELYKHIILGFTKPGDTVLDCFIGSGTTAIACKETGRKFVGIELSEEYCKIAQQRLEGISEPLFL